MTCDLRHGGALDLMREQFPHAPTPWLDLSTGINPFTYPLAGVSTAAINHLPTRTMMDACRKAMSRAFGAPTDSLVLAPGSELLIRLLPTVIAPRTVAILRPSYSDYAEVWRAAGAQVIETGDPLAYTDRADVVIVCNPNNPDGRLFERDKLEEARACLAARGGWLIIDEAYADLAPEASLAPSGGKDGLIILRSFGKFFGLAGVRLGAAIVPSSLRTLMSKRLGTWPVSGAALEIGTQAYADLSWQLNIRKTLQAMRLRLDQTLNEHALNVCGGTDLFRLIEADRAHDLWRQLAQHGVYTRRFAWSERHLRIGLPFDMSAEERLKQALNP